MIFLRQNDQSYKSVILTILEAFAYEHIDYFNLFLNWQRMIVRLTKSEADYICRWAFGEVT